MKTHDFNMAVVLSGVKAGEVVMGGPACYGQIGGVVSLILLVAIE